MGGMTPIVLASSSPRRIELMSWLDVPFEAISPDVNEQAIRHSSPAKLTELLAEAKAEALRESSPNSIIIGCDTVISFQGEILEKPRSVAHTREMLRLQRGNSSEIYSSICLINTATGRKAVTTKKTLFTMTSLTDSQIDQYAAAGSGLDKAGGFGIQDENGLFIKSIDGCYTNVVGLPLCEVSEILRQMSISIQPGIKEKALRKTGRAC